MLEKWWFTQKSFIEYIFEKIEFKCKNIMQFTHIIWYIFEVLGTLKFVIIIEENLIYLSEKFDIKHLHIII